MKKNNFKIDFIGIGAQRCASTWISQCLKEHPQICFSLKKEASFFNEEKDLEYYKSYFNHCSNKSIKGEFSPQYMHPEYAAIEKTAKKIKRFFPEIRLIVSLRNPVKRAYSQYFLERSPGERFLPPTFPSTFEEFVLKNFHNCVKAGFYQTILRPYLDLFPRENILILIYEDIKRGPLKFIQSIYDFLEIDPDFIPPSLNRNFALPPKQKFIFYFTDKLRKYLKRYYSMPLSRPSVPYPPMELETREHLQKVYKDEIRDLEKLMKRDLSFWK